MKRHRMDVASLVFGLLFASAGTLLLLEGFELADFNIGQLWPAFLVLIGLAILLASRGSDEKRTPEPAANRAPEATLPLPKVDS